MRTQMVAAIVSCTTLAIVAFAIGFVCGKDAGIRRARELAANNCLEWARLALHGHEKWRVSAVTALQRAAALLNP